jgi:plastocyanin
MKRREAGSLRRSPSPPVPFLWRPKMRRVFSLLLLTPFLASCADSATPVAPAGAVLTEGAVAAEESWPVEENWFTAEGTLELVEDGMSLQSADVSATANAPAKMVFGNPDAGTDFPGAPGTHDQSFHARDKINPGSVTIKAGETVTFQVNFGHRVAIYQPGVQPQDIQPNPGPLLLYAPGRLFLQPSPAPQFTLRFLTPGKYLVLCAISMHFFEGRQWGWIHVQ